MSGINFGLELKQLKDLPAFWKPKAGEHKVLFMSNGEKLKSTFEGKEIDKCRFLIEVKKEKYTWDVTVGSTPRSLWGQLCAVGNFRNGLDGNFLTVLVNGDGIDKRYTIVEAIQLLGVDEEED